MTTFALPLLGSMLLTMLAASSSSAQTCTDCIPVPRSTFELSKKAVDEVKVSRPLIEKLTRENELLRENGQLKDQLIQAHAENSKLKDAQNAEKDKQIDGERTAREATEKQLTIETKEKEKAQRSSRFWRKVATVTTAAAAVLIYGALN